VLVCFLYFEIPLTPCFPVKIEGHSFADSSGHVLVWPCTCLIVYPCDRVPCESSKHLSVFRPSICSHRQKPHLRPHLRLEFAWGCLYPRFDLIGSGPSAPPYLPASGPTKVTFPSAGEVPTLFSAGTKVYRERCIRGTSVLFQGFLCNTIDDHKRTYATQSNISPTSHHYSLSYRI
jgi:hypothetical protein